MIKITYLQSAEEVLKAFNSVRHKGDNFPYIGNAATIIVGMNDRLTLEFGMMPSEQVEISPNVTYKDLCIAMADELDIAISFSPKE